MTAAAVLRPGPRRCAGVAAALLVASIGYALLRVPVQLYDSVDEIVLAQRSPGVVSAFTATIGGRSYFRPLRVAETKLLFDLSNGNYQLVYRGFHVLLLAAAVFLFLRLLDVRTVTDLGAALFALAVLTGLHTFPGLLREAFPINHFLQVVVLCLIAANLSRAKPRWSVDVAAVLTFVAACLTLESGVLVAVVLFADRIAGRRGVSNHALAAVSILLVCYLWLRFGYLSDGVKRMGMASGYGFRRLDVDELRARFGNRMAWFAAYNFAAAVSSVLFSEPRNGVFIFVHRLVAGELRPYLWIAFLSSVLTTGVIVAAVISWRSAPRERRSSPADLTLFVVVLGANAVACYAYVKEEIMTVAGAFYALAAFWAVRQLLGSIPNWRTGPVMVLAAALFVAGTGWSLQTVGLQNLLRVQTYRVHTDWGSVPDNLIGSGKWPDDQAAQTLVLELRRQALAAHAPNPGFVPRWFERVFEGD